MQTLQLYDSGGTYRIAWFDGDLIVEIIGSNPALFASNPPSMTVLKNTPADPKDWGHHGMLLAVHYLPAEMQPKRDATGLYWTDGRYAQAAFKRLETAL